MSDRNMESAGKRIAALVRRIVWDSEEVTELCHEITEEQTRGDERLALVLELELSIKLVQACDEDDSECDGGAPNTGGAESFSPKDEQFLKALRIKLER